MSAHHAHAEGASLGLWAVWLLVVAVIALYAMAACQRPGWRRWQCASFIGGGALLLLGFSAPVVSWAHADLRGHMAQHLLLGMFAPLLLVLGAPVTLLLASVPPRAGRAIVRLLHSSPARVLTHPFSALVLNIGGMFVLYATPLFVASTQSPWLHALVHYHFVAAGYLFAWAIAGPDPAPARPSLWLRGWVLFIGIGLHGTLAKWMYVHGWPQGTGRPLQEVQAAAQWMYYGGDIAEMLLIAAFAATWYHALVPRQPHASSHRLDLRQTPQ
ncbi:MAG TPA: cytochrome c oxidase assembly protein [Stenotrophomonas sp.]|nr:cytochrome c oxidase assembly protein [Stenotrophomonas sp.]